MAPQRSDRARKSRKSKKKRSSAVSGTRLRSAWWLPLGFTVALALLASVPRVAENVALQRSVLGAAAVLVVWQIFQWTRARGASPRVVEVVLRPQHYLQAMVQCAVFLYWGYYWRPVYDYAWLLVAQLAFAYAFDMLLSWSRRQRYVFGFGPFPIIFSTNLFLWFRDDWYYLQFVMVAVGFLGKEFVRWHRDGRYVHIFNPSAFSLALFSLILIATRTTELTWGQEIASTLTLAPNIYLFLFLIGLVVMYFFSITLVAGSAAVVLFGASHLYASATGVPYFIDSEIPTAVFLGLHLLVTDPSTSPRKPAGKLIFGVLYGVGVFALYALLGGAGVPTFYDKLLCVPLLNLSVQWIDRVVRGVDENLLSRFAPDWQLASVNLAFMSVWIVFFGAMTLVGRTDATHEGDKVPFWQQACAEGRPRACERLLQIESTYCSDNSGWACNELGRYFATGDVAERDPDRALGYFARACELRFSAGCVNLLDPTRGAATEPRVLDLFYQP